jgi:hypothetical protein
MSQSTRGITEVGATRKRSWYRRYPAAQFLAALALAIVSSPYTEEMRDGDLIEAVRLTVVLFTGLLAVGENRRTAVLGIGLVLPALIGKWVNHWLPELVPDWTFLLPGVLFVTFLIAYQLRFILRAPHVNSEVLCAGISGYLLLGLLWSLAYVLVAQLSPGAFAFTTGPDASHVMKGFTALYFSFVTLSTVGYGDIAAVSNSARMLAMTEATVGIFYTTILIARLVSAYSSAPPTAGPQDNQRL